MTKKIEKEVKEVEKVIIPKIKQELVKEGKEDKMKTTYPDGTVEYRTL